MPLPWKKSKSGRISRFVSDFQQSPKHGGSLVVETGFPTSLIDLFVKNRDRLKKQSSKRNNNNKTPSIHSIPTRRLDSSQPSPPPQMQRHKSLPSKLDDPSSVKDVKAPTSKVEESFVINDGGLTSENKLENGGNDGGGGGGGGGCVLMVVAFKVFVVAVLALSTKRLAVGITLSAFALIFLEIAVARIFTLLNLCPNARVRFGSLMGKIVGKKKQRGEEKKQEESPPERKNRVTFEIIEESTLEEAKPVEVEEGEREVETIRDVVFKKEKSKSSKLKSKIVKKIVPKKLRSYKKKNKKNRDEEKDVEIIEIIGGGDEEEEEESVVTEVSSLFSDERIGSEISERDEVSSNPPLLESCEEIMEEEEEERGGSKEDLTKAMVLIVIVLAGLLIGKVVAIGLTLSSCLILRLVCYNKSQTSL